MKKYEIRMDGVVNTDMTEDQFYDSFIDFIESKDSFYGGGTRLIQENDEFDKEDKERIDWMKGFDYGALFATYQREALMSCLKELISHPDLGDEWFEGWDDGDDRRDGAGIQQSKKLQELISKAKSFIK